MTYRFFMDYPKSAAPAGVPGRPPEIPPNPPGAPGPAGPDIRPPLPEVPDIPTPAEAPILDPPPAPGSSPPVMLGDAFAAVSRRLFARIELALENLSVNWPTGVARAPVRVVASSPRQSLPARRERGN
jgi:hypothetical protein